MTSGTTNISYVYNADGLRVRKTVGSTVTQYTLYGKNIAHLTRGGDALHFFYDAQNRPSIVVFNGTCYAYIHNLQGDTVGILDAAGNEAVRYVYDAWGRLIGTAGALAGTLGYLNPFRYRGYAYDEETGLYYLRSRYFNPGWGRFVNADAVIGQFSGLLSHNQFTYCMNNPMNIKDTDGNIPCNALMMSDGGCYKSHYPYYGLTKRIANAINIILADQTAYGYLGAGIESDKGVIWVCCVSLIRGLLGGEADHVTQMMEDINEEGRLYPLTSLDQLKPGYLVFQENKHVGLVLMYDFGQGYELAVFQSTSEKKFSSIPAAKFMNDENAGPNITALRDLGNWDFYSDITFDSGAFFLNKRNKWYLFGK